MPETETGAAVLEVARSLRPRILAERDRIEASRRLPDDIARELAHAGFFRIFLPAAYGGLDLTPRKVWRFSRNWLALTPRSRGACGTAILIGLPPNSPLKLQAQSTTTPMSLPRTVRAPRGRPRSSPVDTA
jgi:alkylation response protein AidB-like acyl-CoA dehydrogenase